MPNDYSGERAARESPLPAFLTLIEALVWIVLRDHAALRDASVEAPRPAGTYVAEIASADGPALREMPGRDGYGLTRLAAEWAWRKAEGMAVGMPLREAIDALLAALRAGTVAAEGRTPEDARRRPLSPADWRGATITEAQRGVLIAEPTGAVGGRIVDVLIDREGVLKAWPPLGADPGYRSGGPGRPSSRHLIEAEHRRRRTAGLALPTDKQEADVLIAWLRETHPGAPPVSPKTVRNWLAEWRRAETGQS